MLNGFKEGFKNLVRTPWLSATAISVLVISILAVSFVGSFRTLAYSALKLVDKQVAINVYLKDELASDSDIQNFQTKLKSDIPLISSIVYKSKEDAKKDKAFAGNSTIDESFRNLGYNPLSNSFTVKTDDTKNYSKLSELLSSSTYSKQILNVKFEKSVFDSIDRIYNATFWIILIVIGFLGLVSTLVMINVLRMSIYHFKDEIEIRRLVGATNGYIQQPFIVQGFMFGVIACVVAGVIFYPLFFFANPYIVSALGLDYQKSSELVMQINVTILVTFLVSILSTVITSYYSSKRYLQF
jgi:cell division transport system permease protein